MKAYVISIKEKKPVALSFESGVPIWLVTTVGTIRLDAIPNELSRSAELDALIGENGYDESYLISLINKYIDENWGK